jgi:hypothetical protein
MRSGYTHILTALALLVSTAPGISLADIGWPEAVGRLAGERLKAETCASLFKEYADKQQIPQGQLAYGEAKANFDAVIAECRSTPIALASCRKTSLQADAALFGGGPSRISFRWGWSFADASSAQPGSRRRQATRRDP